MAKKAVTSDKDKKQIASLEKQVVSLEKKLKDQKAYSKQLRDQLKIADTKPAGRAVYGGEL